MLQFAYYKTDPGNFADVKSFCHRKKTVKLWKPRQVVKFTLKKVARFDKVKSV